MKTILKIALTISPILILMVSAIDVKAQTEGSMRGCITDSRDKKLAGVIILLLDSAEHDLDIVTQTDSGGCYYLPTLCPGVYGIQIQQRGYRTRRIVGIRITDQKVTTANTHLSTVPETSREIRHHLIPKGHPRPQEPDTVY